MQSSALTDSIFLLHMSIIIFSLKYMTTYTSKYKILDFS